MSSATSHPAGHAAVYQLGLQAIRAWLALARCCGLLLRGVHLAGVAARVGFWGTDFWAGNTVPLLRGLPGGDIVLDIYPVC